MKSTTLRLGPWVVLGAILFLLNGCNPPTSSSSGGGGNNSGTQSNPIVLTVGSSTTSSIDAFGAVHYKFTTVSPDSYYTISLTGADSDLSWDLYGDVTFSDSSWTAGCDDYWYTADESCTTAFTLGAYSNFFIKVIEWDGVAGNYTITVTASSGGGGAIRMTGQPYLSTSSATVGNGITVYVPVDSGVGYVYVELWDGSGSSYAFGETYTSGNTTAAVSLVVPLSTPNGTYYLGFIGLVSMTTAANTGYYDDGGLYHEVGYDDSDIFFDNGPTGWSVQSLSVSGASGTTVYINTMPDNTGSYADTQITLYDSLLNQLAFDDDSGLFTTSALTQSLASGTYYLKINGFSGSIGPYGVYVSTFGYWGGNSNSSAGMAGEDSYEIDDTSGTATALTFDVIQDHNIYSSYNDDWFFFVVP